MSATPKNDFEKFKEKEPECFQLDTLTDKKYLENRLWYAFYAGYNSVDEETRAKIAKLESLLEAETSRAEGWIKQYYHIKEKLDLNIAITGNEYSIKPKE